jgi:hypothetical protein
LVNQGNDGDKRDYRVSFAKIRRELGFKPHYTVAEGVREIAAALRVGQIGNYLDKCYSNYKTLSEPTNYLTIRSRHIYGVHAPSATEVEALPTPVRVVARG